LVRDHDDQLIRPRGALLRKALEDHLPDLRGQGPSHLRGQGPSHRGPERPGPQRSETWSSEALLATLKPKGPMP